VVADVSFAASEAVVEELLLELDVGAGGASVVVGVVGAAVDGAGGADVAEGAGGARAPAQTLFAKARTVSA